MMLFLHAHLPSKFSFSKFLSAMEPDVRHLQPELTSFLPAQLLNIRVGPGAAVVSRDVTRIHMDFASNLEKGHTGPRYVDRGL